MWEWYEWNLKKSFDEWHQNLKLSLNYSSDENYTHAFKVDSKWIALVEREKADGLQLTELRKPKPDGVQ